MKKIVIPLVLIVAIVINQSCDDYVDIVPKGSAIASSLDDVNQLLGNANTLSGDFGNAIPSLVNDNLQVTDAKLGVAARSRETDHIRNIYLLEPIFYTGVQTDEAWSKQYINIGYANYILEVLNGIDTDDPLKNIYAGEAKVHRAYHYFQLVNVYGVHYGLPQAAEAGSGVPLITIFGDDSAPISRNSVNEVYDLIIQDLTEAIIDLPNRNGTNNRPSKEAALGLLAEVYLHMGNYEESLFNAEAALAINSTIQDYNTDLDPFSPTPAPLSGIDNTESFLLKPTSPLVIFEPVTFERFLFSGYSDELLSIIDTENDLRFRFTAEDPISGNIVVPVELSFELGVTTPKLLLIQAECLARTGNTVAAMDVVNVLRANRFEASFVAANGHVLSAGSNEEAIAHIIAENRREFTIRGNRFFDIKRLNAIENAGIFLTRGNTTYAPNSSNWAMPISEKVINTSNGQIQQNPRE